jgi:hypothetical protein
MLLMLPAVLRDERLCMVVSLVEMAEHAGKWH